MDERVAFRIDEGGATALFRAWCREGVDITEGVSDLSWMPTWVPFWRVDIAASVRWQGTRGRLRPGANDLLADASYDWTPAQGQVAVAEVAWVHASSADTPRSRRAARGQPIPTPPRAIDEPATVSFEEIRGRADDLIREAVERSTRANGAVTRLEALHHDSRMVTPELVGWPTWHGTYRYGSRTRTVTVDGCTGELSGRRPTPEKTHPGTWVALAALAVVGIAATTVSVPAGAALVLAAVALGARIAWRRKR